MIFTAYLTDMLSCVPADIPACEGLLWLLSSSAFPWRGCSGEDEQNKDRLPLASSTGAQSRAVCNHISLSAKGKLKHVFLLHLNDTAYRSVFAFKLDRIIYHWLLISEGLITSAKVNQTLISNKIAVASVTCRTFIIFLFPCKRMHH